MNLVSKIYIKKTSKNDENFYLKLRNKLSNRKISLFEKKISQSKHSEWFANKYNKNYYYTCYTNQKKIGYIRGDIEENFINISIVIDNKYHKKNIASICYNYFEKKINKNFIIIAKVKKNNLRSIKFFKKNGFTLLNSKNNFFCFFKIHMYKKNNFEKTIDQIQNVRKLNNVNWMSILKLAFKSSPQETSEIFRKIHDSDKKINFLSKKLF